MSQARKFSCVLVIVVLAALALAAPLWGPGLVNTRGGGDSPFLLQRTQQLAENLRAGVFPVRWMPDGAYGFGFPFYNYYSALPFYFAGTLVLLGLDILAALRFVQTLGFVLSAVAMYGWIWRLSRNRWAACLAGVAYAAAPFHLVNVYVRGDSLSEFFAFAFYPLILWGLDKMQDGDLSALRLGRVSVPFTAAWVLPALAYAGLIMTHNISAFIFSPFLVLYLLALLWRRPARRRYLLIAGALAVVCGLLVSAWAWMPALAETGLVQSQTLTDDYFHYSRHFRTSDLVQRSLLFNYSVAPGRDSPFAMGLPQATFGLLGAVALVAAQLSHRTRTWDWRSRPTGAVFCLLGLVLSTLLITPASKLLWDGLPLLPMTQFPWRFLSVQSLFIAAATAALISTRGRRAFMGLAVAAVLVASVLVPLKPERLPIAPDDVTTDRLQLYELFTQNIGTTIRYEWLPSDAVPRPFTSDALVEPGVPDPARPLDGSNAAGTLVERGPTSQEWRITGDSGRLAFPVLYWPGWSATVDGECVPIQPVEGSGFISIAAPSGDHTVLLRLGRTPVRLVAEAASVLALGLIALALVISRRTVRWRRAARYFGAVAVPSLMALLLPAGILSGGAGLTMDFDQMPYLHHTPGGVAFREGPRLDSYSLAANEVAPGSRLSVRLDWSGVASAYTATLRLLSPAAPRHEVVPLSEATNKVSEDGGDWVLHVPDETPRGIYLLELRVYGPQGEVRALTPGGRTRGPLFLAPVRVPHGPALPTDMPILAPFGPAIRLHSVTVAPVEGDQIEIGLEWSTRDTLSANYGISLRLLSSSGEGLSTFDSQPGYGFLPTSMWRAGELVTDRYVIAGPDGGVQYDDCRLHVILYQVSSGLVIGEGRFGAFDLPLRAPFVASPPRRLFGLPEMEHMVGVDFGEQVELAGYALDRQVGAIGLNLWWRALTNPADDYTVFVHLVHSSGGEILVQSDAMPRGGAYPTSWWVPGEVVSDTVWLSTEGLPSGEYSLAIGLYDRAVTRLRAVGPDGEHSPDDRWVLDESVAVE